MKDILFYAFIAVVAIGMVVSFIKTQNNETRAAYIGVLVALGGLGFSVYQSSIAQSKWALEFAKQNERDRMQREYARWRVKAIPSLPPVARDVEIRSFRRKSTLPMECYRLDLFPIFVNMKTKTTTDVHNYENPPIRLECNADYLDVMQVKETGRFVLPLSIRSMIEKHKDIILTKRGETPSENQIYGVFIQLHYWHSSSDLKEYRVEGQVPLTKRAVRSGEVRLHECGWYLRNASAFSSTCNPINNKI